MSRPTRALLLAAVLVLACAALLRPPEARSADVDRPLPAFTQTTAAGWLNSAPLRTADLAGQVALVEVWTYDCVNCLRSLPWLKQLQARYAGRPFRLLGIHSPEFDYERVPANVAAHLHDLGVTWPVMLDADLGYWNALANRYWPAFYLVDARGRIRGVYVGETHPGDAQATRIEGAIEALLGASLSQL